MGAGIWTRVLWKNSQCSSTELHVIVGHSDLNESVIKFTTDKSKRINNK